MYEYTDEQLTNLQKEYASLARPKVLLDQRLTEVAAQLRVPRARVFLQQGVMRRLGTIHRAAENVFRVFPPSQKEALSRDARSDAEINVHAFMIGVYGIFENTAWVCALEGGFPDPDKNFFSIGLFRKELAPYLPVRLRDYLRDGPSHEWHKKYAKLYRDATAHRIPPYIPPYLVLDRDRERYQALESGSWRALFEEHDLEKHGRLDAEKKALERVSFLMGLSLSDDVERDPMIVLHPQLVCDVMTIHELLTHFVDGMREQYGYPSSRVDDLDQVIGPL